MPEQIVCVRDTKVTKFSGFATFVEKIGKVKLVYWIVADYTQRTKNLTCYRPYIHKHHLPETGKAGATFPV